MSEPKSKGRVTYWAARNIGKSEPNHWFAEAQNNTELEALKGEIYRWNANTQNNKVELVRVEVTPS